MGQQFCHAVLFIVLVQAMMSHMQYIFERCLIAPMNGFVGLRVGWLVGWLVARLVC